jgi:hypothetical protein
MASTNTKIQMERGRVNAICDKDFRRGGLSADSPEIAPTPLTWLQSKWVNLIEKLPNYIQIFFLLSVHSSGRNSLKIMITKK